MPRGTKAEGELDMIYVGIAGGTHARMYAGPSKNDAHSAVRNTECGGFVGCGHDEDSANSDALREAKIASWQRRIANGAPWRKPSSVPLSRATAEWLIDRRETDDRAFDGLMALSESIGARTWEYINRDDIEFDEVRWDAMKARYNRERSGLNELLDLASNGFPFPIPDAAIR